MLNLTKLGGGKPPRFGSNKIRVFTQSQAFPTEAPKPQAQLWQATLTQVSSENTFAALQQHE